MKQTTTIFGGYAGEYADFATAGLFGMRSGEKAMAAKEKRETVPVFFASDDNYLPFLDVALSSVKANASKKFDYKIFVLHSGIKGKNAEKVMRLSDDGFQIRFVDVADHLKKIAKFLQLRDYYTSAIYYRLFIVGMFPQLDKAVYLDCDTVVLGDISELYFTDLKENLIGAVADGAVASVPVFSKYTKEVLGIEGKNYFNSGVIVMNLKKFREVDFYGAFCEMLAGYDFRVAPDQACLNLLCKDKVYYFSEAWNRMPQGVANGEEAKLVHYNLAQKPWHYKGVKYEEYFWQYAKNSVFYPQISAQLQAFTPEMARRDQEGGENLLKLAQSESEREDNYYRRYLAK